MPVIQFWSSFWWPGPLRFLQFLYLILMLFPMNLVSKNSNKPFWHYSQISTKNWPIFSASCFAWSILGSPRFLSNRLKCALVQMPFSSYKRSQNLVGIACVPSFLYIPMRCKDSLPDFGPPPPPRENVFDLRPDQIKKRAKLHEQYLKKHGLWVEPPAYTFEVSKNYGANAVRVSF